MVIFRSKKKKNGDTTRFPLNERTTGQQYIMKYANQWRTNGSADMIIQGANVKKVMDAYGDDISKVEDEVTIFHRVLLGTINLETLQELNALNPTFETDFLSKLEAVAKLKESNLMVYKGGDKNALIVNITVPSKDANGQLQKIFKSENLVPLSKLQVLPISKNVYMDLNTKGGFYYRDKNILIPFSKLTPRGYIAEVKDLISSQGVKNIATMIQWFNDYIARAYRETNDLGVQYANQRTAFEGSNDINIVGAPNFTPEEARQFESIIAGGNNSSSDFMDDLLSQGGDKAIGAILGKSGKEREEEEKQKQLKDREKNQSNTPQFNQQQFLFQGNKIKGILDDPNYDTLKGRLSGPMFNASSFNDKTSILSDAALYAYVNNSVPQDMYEQLNTPLKDLDQGEKNSLDDFIAFSEDGKQVASAQNLLVKAFNSRNQFGPEDPQYSKDYNSLYEKLQSDKALNTLWRSFLSSDNKDARDSAINFVKTESSGQLNF